MIVNVDNLGASVDVQFDAPVSAAGFAAGDFAIDFGSGFVPGNTAPLQVAVDTVRFANPGGWIIAGGELYELTNGPPGVAFPQVGTIP